MCPPFSSRWTLANEREEESPPRACGRHGPGGIGTRARPFVEMPLPGKTCGIGGSGGGAGGRAPAGAGKGGQRTGRAGTRPAAAGRACLRTRARAGSGGAAAVRGRCRAGRRREPRGAERRVCREPGPACRARIASALARWTAGHGATAMRRRSGSMRRVPATPESAATTSRRSPAHRRGAERGDRSALRRRALPPSPAAAPPTAPAATHRSRRLRSETAGTAAPHRAAQRARLPLAASSGRG